MPIVGHANPHNVATCQICLKPFGDSGVAHAHGAVVLSSLERTAPLAFYRPPAKPASPPVFADATPRVAGTIYRKRS